MIKSITLGTKISDAVTFVEGALVTDSVTLTASGNAISKAITISEIVKRNAGDTHNITQSNALSKVPLIPKKKRPGPSVPKDSEEGEWQDIQPKGADKFQPRLEITLSRQ